MSTKELTVTGDVVVSLAYVLRLDDQEVVDRSRDGEPLEFLHGRGQIIPGLESALQGMAIGEEKEVVVAPADGYGDYDPEDIEVMPRTAFPDDMKLDLGASLAVRDSETGEYFRAFVTEMRDDSVTLDYNHPLAGEELYFHVKIVGLREATAEELAHGHAHGPGHAH